MCACATLDLLALPAMSVCLMVVVAGWLMLMVDAQSARLEALRRSDAH